MTPSQPGGALPGARFAARIEWHDWAAPAVLVGILLGAGALYWPSTASLWVEWFETPASAYRHGPLLLVIATWLAIRAIRAARAPLAPDGRSWVWALLLAGTSFAWLIAVRAGIQVGHQALLPLLIWLAIRVVLGRRIALLVAVPIGLLYSTVPVWHALVPALQSMTVVVVSTGLQIVAIPAYVVGDYVHIRSGVFHVEDGCAGLHYFVVAVTLAALYGELRGDRWRVRAYLIAMAVAVALISNWLRVFIIIVAGYLTDMQSYLVRVDHAAFGWVVFGVAMLIFLLLARFLPLSKLAPACGETGAARTPVVAQATVVAVLAAALGPGWALFTPVRAAAAPNVTLPSAVAGWLGPQTPCHGRWQPEYPAADRRERGEFSRDGQAVCVYVASFLSQHQGKELVGYGSSIYPPESEVVSTAVRQVAGRAVNEAQLGDEWVADRLVWYSYAVGGREMRRGVESQLAYALGSLSGAPASSVFAASTPCLPDCAAARRLLEDFWPEVGLNHDRAP